MELQRAVIEVFGGCNYTCQMCPQTWGRGKNWTRKMSLDLFVDILDQITPKYGTPVINLEGSGEPTLAVDLPLYIEECSKRNLKTYIYSNGSRFTGPFMQDCIDAGLSFFRFSCIGYNREQYAKWMNTDRFEEIKNYAIQAKDYIKKHKKDCIISSYHLILDNNNINYEIEQYRKNWIESVDCIGYIWKMHNWSGNYDTEYKRQGAKRTCGRPFSNELYVRAGGLEGKTGAVVPCCDTLGDPNESKGVLGHLEDQSFEDIWYGEKYNNLRQSHKLKKWPDYCDNCDFLIDDPEVLAWTNDKQFKLGNILGTKINLKDFI